METMSFDIKRITTDLYGNSMQTPIHISPNKNCVEQIGIIVNTIGNKAFKVSVVGAQMNIVYSENKKASEMSIPICDAEKMCYNILQMISDLSFNENRIDLKKKEDEQKVISEKHITDLKESGLEIKIKTDTSYLYGTKEKEGGMNIVETGGRENDKIFISVYTKTHGELAGMEYKNIYELQESFNKEGYEEITK